jgi:hypothetical protein
VAGDTIGTASIRLEADTKPLEASLQSAQGKVQASAATMQQSASTVSAGFRETSNSARAIGDETERGATRGESAFRGLKQAIAGLGAALASFQQGLRIGNNLFGDSEQIRNFFQQFANGRSTLDGLKSQLNDVNQQIARLEEADGFDRSLNDFNALVLSSGTTLKDLREQQKVLSGALSRSAKQGAEEERQAREKAAESIGEASRKRAQEMEDADLAGVEKVRREEQRALERIEADKKRLRDSAVSEETKRRGILALAEEESVVRSRAKRDAERETAKSLAEQARDTARRAQVESDARAQAQRDQNISAAIYQQAVMLGRVLQAIEIQTDIQRNTKRSL